MVLELTLYIASYFLVLFLISHVFVVISFLCSIDIDYCIVGFGACKKGMSLHLCT